MIVDTRAALFCLLFLLISPDLIQAQLKPEQVPSFQVRARVMSAGEKGSRATEHSFRYGVRGSTAKTQGNQWSEWLSFTREQIDATLKGYPAIYMKGWPIVARLVVGGVVDPTVVEAELKFDESEDTIKLVGELFGPRLGILVWRDDTGDPQAATMAEYNHRYWKPLKDVAASAGRGPLRKFPTVDRFIGGDDDRRAWREGIEQLNRAGFSAIMLPPNGKLRQLLLEAGQRRTAWAVYNPPGYAFDFDPNVTDESITAWAEKQAKPYRDAGYRPEDMALFAMSDEPGWYYPQMFERLKQNPVALARFRDYLKSQGLTLQTLDVPSWDHVQPVGRSQANDLPSKRLFYWTMRFFPHDSARHFARCTRQLETAFYPNVPALTNWNFFSGRFYVPGPVANNRDKQNPNAAMGGHDWLEFGRMRGCTMLWTEDWFSDAQAYQWSFYCAKLRCAADKGNVQFGGYVIPRTAGDREDGILQKTLCIVGSGGKALKYYVFGPEYNFPGNCYSEKAQLLPKIADAHAMIGAAEDLLWPGRRPRPQVAILHPRSAQVWDAADIAVPNQIRDATNTHLNRATVDYMAEVFNLYLALQHANIPVDFVEEDDLSPQGLRPYGVLYVTEPNLAEQHQRGLVQWMKAGGTLVTVSGAATRDCYDEPCSILREATSIREQDRRRLLVADTGGLPDVGQGNGHLGQFTAVGVRGKIPDAAEGVVATFGDKTPAIVRRAVGKGEIIHFAWMPGLSYWKSSREKCDGLPVGFSESIRNWIAWPVQLAEIENPVVIDHALVETPLLISDAGAAVTLLNWTGDSIDSLHARIHVPFSVTRVESVRRGKVSFTQTGQCVELSLPLDAADILLLQKSP